MTWPAEALIDQGADLYLRDANDGDADIDGMFEDTVDPVTGKVVASKLVDVIAPDADVVVLQRPLHRKVADAIPLLQAKGVRVVVEVDDDFSTIHPRNVSFAAVHPRTSPDRNFHHLLRACAYADHVVVTTTALARRYAKHGRWTVVPNHIPAAYFDEQRELHDGGLFVGWTGSVDTHPTDLQVTGGGVARALGDTGARFAVIGTGKGVQKNLDLQTPPLASGWLELDEYPAAVAQLDVGIVPLDLTAFNHAKSWLKGLEMAALGVPFVASPTDDYVRLAKLGAGVLAGKPREWRRELDHLILDIPLREEAAGRGRAMAGEWTIEGNADRWWNAWTAPLRERRAA